MGQNLLQRFFLGITSRPTIPFLVPEGSQQAAVVNNVDAAGADVDDDHRSRHRHQSSGCYRRRKFAGPTCAASDPAALCSHWPTDQRISSLMDWAACRRRWASYT
jgi:hypothetical protein